MEQNVKRSGKKAHDARNYQSTQMQRDIVIQKLKERGCRITKQRLILLDIILNEECSCCKEIYYRAAKMDERVGTATVYRMINTLEEIGAISRKNMYKIACEGECDIQNACTVHLDDDTICCLSVKNWKEVIQAGMKACGYIEEQRIREVTVKQCECEKAG